MPDDGARRRTPGLRREELAALAGVGVSWYTWLEQGRDIHPSPEVLDALARALRLDAAERGTLFALARVELPLPDGSESAPDEGDDGRALLVSLVDALHPTPAYLLGPMTRILAWNPAASALFGSPAHLPSERCSLLWLLLVDPGEARNNPGRDGTARNMVARFRSEYARHAGEPAYEHLSPSCASVARGLHGGGVSSRSPTLSAARRRSSIRRWGRCACTTRRRCRPARLTSG